jgi:hypothetical protein
MRFALGATFIERELPPGLFRTSIFCRVGPPAALVIFLPRTIPWIAPLLEPDPEGHRTKANEGNQEGPLCDSKGDEHSSSMRTMGAKDVIELIVLGLLGTAVTIFSGGSMPLQPAGVIAPTVLPPHGQPRGIGDNCPYCI